MSQQMTRAPQPTTTARAGQTPERRSTLADQDGERTYDELYEEARKRGLKGRSKMSKTELERALAL